MATRKPLFMSSPEGFSEEMAATDSLALGGLTMSGAIAMGGNLITGLADPLAATDAVTKQYADALVQSLNIHPSCDAMSATNIATLSGLSTTVDGIALDTDGMRVLLTGQTSGIANGVYVVHSGAWTRATDMPIGEHAAGSFFFIHTGGTTYGSTGWVVTNDNPTDVVGTDALTFTQFSGAGTYTNGSGLSLTGSTFSVKKGDGIEITSNSGAVNVDLAASNPGLTLTGSSPNKKLAALVDGSGGLQIGSSGLAAKLNGATLSVGASGLAVLGLPSLFTIAGTAVGATVTAPNLDTLTDGANADALHVHSVGAATEAPKVSNALPVAEAVAAGDPVYFSTTNDRVGKGDTVDSKAKIVGVAATGQVTVGNTAPIITSGVASGVLSGATSGDPYYLATGGGLSTSTPGAGKRVIQVGVAKNATDLWVRVIDFGKKAA